MFKYEIKSMTVTIELLHVNDTSIDCVKSKISPKKLIYQHFRVNLGAETEIGARIAIPVSKK